jgi:hypothetical protein
MFNFEIEDMCVELLSTGGKNSTNHPPANLVRVWRDVAVRLAESHLKHNAFRLTHKRHSTFTQQAIWQRPPESTYIATTFRNKPS